ncbi:MAG: hypothetical protein ACLQVN_09135 [Bryobacteraceae bacterium]
MLSFAVPGTAAVLKKCACQAVTPASYTWNFPAEANRIFQAIQTDAQQVLNQADKLQASAEDQELDWQTQGDRVNTIRTEVNDMGAKVCRLGVIRRVVKPWQQKEIDRIKADVLLMADNTQYAITFGNSHQNTLWLMAYRDYANNLYADSKDLTRSVDKAVAYANISKEYRNLGHSLGVRAAS